MLLIDYKDVSSQGFGDKSGVGLNYQNMGGSSGHIVSGPHPNAWGLRKEAAAVNELAPAAWSAPDAALKLAHASALEKVSSGRWHSKSSSPPDVENIRQPEDECDFQFGDKDRYDKSAYNPGDVVGGTDYHVASLVNQAKKSLTVDDVICGGGKDVPAYERARTPVSMEANERIPLDNVNGFRLPHHVGKPGGTELQSAVNSELSERPKLKLLPRSKPIDNQEPPTENNLPTVPVNVEYHSQSYGMQNPPKSGFVGSESGNPIVARPKLNLKPRSEPLKPAEGNAESKRNTLFGNTLFGGNRPRELVLEWGIDNVAVNNDDLSQPLNRVKQDTIKTDRVPVHASSVRYNDRPDNIPVEHRLGKNSDRRDHRLEVERTDVQRRNWQGEKFRNKRDFEKQHQHQHQHQHQQHKQQQRPTSPETWRKPDEHLKPALADAPGLRYGKAASAVELAQAFSRSISDSMAADRFSGQRGPQS